MQLYQYTAKDQTGETQKGKVEARDERHAVNVLMERHLVVISLRAISKNGIFGGLSMGGGIKSAERVQFTQQMATMVNAGLPLTDALNLLQVQSKQSLSVTIGDILRDVQGGSSLGDAMAKHPKVFSEVYVALVKSGEAAGKLDEVMNRLAETEEKQHAFKARVRGAMIYPIIVLSVMVIVGVIMMVAVVPELVGMFDELGASLPLPTRILIAVSEIMQKLWWLVTIVLIILGFLFNGWRKTEYGRKRTSELMLKLPIFGPLMTEVILTDFNRTLALLTKAGISILQALGIVSKAMSNLVFREAVDKAAKSVEKGLPLAAALAKQQVFPPLMAQMVSVGEETGKLDEVLVKVSKYFEAEADNKVKNLTTAMEPIIMVIMGIGVAFLVFAVIMPIYELTSQF